MRKAGISGLLWTSLGMRRGGDIDCLGATALPRFRGGTVCLRGDALLEPRRLSPSWGVETSAFYG